MSHDTAVYLTILGMAVVTYLTRAGGLLVMSRLPRSPRVERWLSHLPGTILVSIVAPTLASGGPAEWLGGVGTLLVAWRTRSLPLSMIAGVVLVVLGRHVF